MTLVFSYHKISRKKLTGVAGARVGGVNSVLLDALEELSFLLRHLLLPCTVQDVKHLISHARSAQPSESRKRERHKSQRHERIERDLRNNRFRATR